MDVERLIEVAQQIDLACQEQENRTKYFQELAARARREKRSLSHEIVEQPNVFDMSDLIRDLRKALKAKPKKQKKEQP
jgi:hypothetical protein